MKSALIKVSLIFACAAVFVAKAQNSTPVIIQAMPATSTAPAPKLIAAAGGNASVQDAIKALEKVRAANQETLKHQQAVLEQLDELQKATEQMKVFTKRG